MSASMGRNTGPMIDHATAASAVDDHWTRAFPVIEDYIRIPAKSPAFDADWKQTGHIDQAVELIRAWLAGNAPSDATVEINEIDGRTPVVVVDIPATPGAGRTDTVLLYGHLDKQPEMDGWREGIGPWTPVLEGDRLYGRGGAHSVTHRLRTPPVHSRRTRVDVAGLGFSGSYGCHRSCRPLVVV